MRPAYFRSIGTLLGRVRLSHSVVYALFVCTLIAGIVTSGGMLVGQLARPVDSLLQLGDTAPAPARRLPAETFSAVLEGDAWAESLKTRWDTPSPRSARLGGSPQLAKTHVDTKVSPRESASRPAVADRKTHRTMCVRLCDGYFFPVSFATTRGNFEHDEETCARSCSSPARLYVYENPGGELEDMVSLAGQAYSKLPTAYRFRTELNPSCKCRPDPWDQEAMARHERYAEEAAAKQALRTAGLTAAELKKAATQTKRGEALTPAASLRNERRAETSAPRLSTVAPSSEAVVPDSRAQIVMLNARTTIMDVPPRPLWTSPEKAPPIVASLPVPATDESGLARTSTPEAKPAVKPATKRPAAAVASRSKPNAAASAPRREARVAASAPPRRQTADMSWRTRAFDRN